MNWYKKAQQKEIEENPHYFDIGHGVRKNDLDAIWISDLNGNNFHRTDTTYEHQSLSENVGLNIETGVIKGRYDSDKNIVSIIIYPNFYQYNEGFTTMKEYPNRLINKLYQEFGQNIKIIDYSGNKPKMII